MGLPKVTKQTKLDTLQFLLAGTQKQIREHDEGSELYKYLLFLQKNIIHLQHQVVQE